MTKILDLHKPQKVQYCIPLWLRDEQIKLAIAAVEDRIQPGEVRSDSIALVSYGPSLNDTWEKIRDFKYVMTCSGSHRFLLDRDIVPTWHVEVDPRAHKIQLLGKPDPRVEYLVASTCHPDYVKHLLDHGCRVRLWHVFDSQEDAIRTLPRGEWALTGGCSVGLRTLTIARFMGFVNQHVFGMDGSEGPSGKHAAAHPNQQKDHATVEYCGKEYRTTASMLEAARGTWHELNQMPDVKATFYGEGLVQAMAKDYVPEPAGKGKALIGFTKPELISQAYRELNAKLHRDNLGYGVGGGRHAPVVLKLAEALKTTSLLDYGCGKGYLAKALPFPIWEYDPAVPGKDESPRPADLVVCADVLEHVEPEMLAFVLDDLHRCTRKSAYLVIHTGPSGKVLADGRNAHLIQKDLKWWAKKLGKFFKLGKVVWKDPLIHTIAVPK